MTLQMAKGLLKMQNRSIRKLNGFKLKVGRYEYRLTYKGGLSCYIGIDRRELGRRNFHYYKGFCAGSCHSYKDALSEIIDLIVSRETKQG